jgi:predicted AlkP superfamily phosphohydrolase/phosphomutase
MPAKKVMIIGLDCLEPSLALERWAGSLPVLSSLMADGAHGRLMSIIPPITVPAWSCMMASQTPGDLGVYGFRNRADHGYDNLYVANGSAIRAPRLWDILGRAGKRSIVLGVPGTYPPRPVNGVLVSCFLTPSPEHAYTHPPLLRREIQNVVGEYLFDCPEFRTDDKGNLLRKLYEMADRRFALAEHFLATKPWDFFVMVEMGIDRVHHAFWKDMDPGHRKHAPGSPFSNAILNYYQHVDALTGRLLEFADEETVVMVVSDHGAKRMDGGIRVNEWLRQEGYLNVVQEPSGRTSLKDVGVDWPRTIAWGEGGYYSRISMNVDGREPLGAVPAADYERVRDELAMRLRAIPDESGNDIGTQVFKPEEIYPAVNGVPPDLIVLFGDLSWRSVGTIGGAEGIHTFENDTGPDEANHAQEGVLVMRGPGIEPGQRDGMHLLDVAPTVLELLGIEAPPSMRGHSLLGPARERRERVALS